MKRILFLGDSLTAGYGLGNAANESFPSLIQQKINAEGLHFKVVNAGLSGDTSAGGLARLDYWMTGPIDVFVLELGINDALRGIPADVTRQNLQELVSRVKTKYPAVKMALMGMELPAFIPGRRVAEFRLIFKQIAEANKMAFVPFFLEGVAGMRHLNLNDGLHPSAAGYRVIAEKVWPVLRAILP
jgi:acyl-CoA thioesterase-1